MWSQVVWSGKAKQEEERQVAKKTQLGDLATMPPLSEPLDAPTPSSLSFLVAKLTPFLRSLNVRDCEKETRTLERMNDHREPEASGMFFSVLAVKVAKVSAIPHQIPDTKDSTGFFLSWAASWPVGNVKGGSDCGRTGL